MCAACDARRDEIEPKMTRIRPIADPVIVDFGFGGIMLDIPVDAEEYIDHNGPQEDVLRGCGALLAGGWVAVEARQSTTPFDVGYEVWQVRRFYRAADRGEALDNLELWAQMALVEHEMGADHG